MDLGRATSLFSRFSSPATPASTASRAKLSAGNRLVWIGLGLAITVPQKGALAPRQWSHLLPQAPRLHTRQGWRVRFCRRTGLRAPCPYSSSILPFPPPEGPSGGWAPRARFLPRRRRGEERLAGRGFRISPGFGRGARCQGSGVGRAHSAVKEGNNGDLVGNPRLEQVSRVGWGKKEEGRS